MRNWSGTITLEKKLLSYYNFNFERMFLMHSIFYWSVKLY